MLANTLLAVFIAEPESITPDPSPGLESVDTDSLRLSSPKQYRTNASRRLSGRPPERHSPSLHSISSLTSLKSIPVIDLPGLNPENNFPIGSHNDGLKRGGAVHIIRQVAEWLEQEKARRVARKSPKPSTRGKIARAAEAPSALADHCRSGEATHDRRRQGRHDSEISETSIALEELEQILSGSMHVKEGQATPTVEKKDSYFPHRRSLRKESSKKLMRRSSTVVSSDSEHLSDEPLVPSAEVVLDIRKTLRYSGGATTYAMNLTNASKRAMKENDAWKHFKSEIVTLTHTLRISGWRRVPIERSEEIEVERLCGALTNAIYVVSPPKLLPQTPAVSQVDAPLLVPKKQPP